MQLILFDLFKVLFSFLVCTNAVIDPQKIQELGNMLICGGLASLSLTQNSSFLLLLYSNGVKANRCHSVLMWLVASGVCRFVHFMSGISTVQRSGFA